MSSIAKRRNGKWLARYRDESGKEFAKQFDRKIDGQRWLDEITTSIVTGIYVDPRAGKLTFRDYAGEWLSSQVLRPTSMANYEATLRLNVFPRIGDRPLTAIRPSELRSLVAWMSTEQRLAPRTVRVAMAVVSSVCKSAVLDRRIATSPCAGVKLPEVHKARLDILSTEQVVDLVDATPDDWRAVIVLGAGTGVRQGEMFGLTADRIDFLRRKVTIDRQLMALPRREPYLAPPKTKASVRTIPMPDVVVEALSEHIRAFGTKRDGLLFTPMFRSAFSAKVWRPTVKRAGLPTGTSYHDLRHYFASLLIRHGESVKTVQARLGHSSAAQTLDTYSHLWPDSDDRTRAAVDGVLGTAADHLRTRRTAME